MAAVEADIEPAAIIAIKAHSVRISTGPVASSRFAVIDLPTPTIRPRATAEGQALPPTENAAKHHEKGYAESDSLSGLVWHNYGRVATEWYRTFTPQSGDDVMFELATSFGGLGFAAKSLDEAAKMARVLRTRAKVTHLDEAGSLNLSLFRRASIKDLGARANALMAPLDDFAKSSRTVAVGQFEDEGGNLVTLVATSGDDTLSPAQRSLLEMGELEVKIRKKGMHAEDKLLHAATELGLELSNGRVGASRPICPSCAGALEALEVKAASPLK